ncbi:hypothetical protein BKA83DRAFT_674462 [Pisolithus microcarpus]|nr:hypothetical protein BKA83DRAFT_674462 [Pisolithus microcarpus]
MTRVTNFGRKRTYVQAGFASGEPSTESHVPSRTETPTTSESSAKKRTRTKKSANDLDDDRAHTNPQDDNGKGSGSAGKDKPLSEHRFPKEQVNEKQKREGRHRRLKRIARRQDDTVCFVCREKVGDAPAGEGGKKDVGPHGTQLSRCKKPEDPLSPLPFASCFVCFSKGHLASSCPKNADKGIYPNGGCCKLCGEKTHLAKDCELRKRDRSGTRKNAEVSNDEKGEDKQRKRVEVRTEAHVHTLERRLPETPAKVKKIVYF